MTDTKCFECEADLLGPICPKCNPPLGWQPIETAPKSDEEPVLLYYPKSEFGPDYMGASIVAGWWFSSPKAIDDGWETPFGFVGEPTHWMPLPAPPEEGHYQDQDADQ